MRERRVAIDGQSLRSRDSFHDTFARFFAGYAGT
jgi:hypothetical protein